MRSGLRHSENLVVIDAHTAVVLSEELAQIRNNRLLYEIRSSTVPNSWRSNHPKLIHQRVDESVRF
jgi:hypothetical protein